MMLEKFVAVLFDGRIGLWQDRAPIQTQRVTEKWIGPAFRHDPALIMSGDTLYIATRPMMMEVTVKIVNCITSVMTTLTMPP